MSTISAGTTSGTALVSSGDTTGQLVFQTNGTTTALTLNTNQTATFAGAISAPSMTLSSGALPVSSGGTGSTSLTANNVLLGNGTSALQAVAPGASGNILTSNGTTWQSTAPAATAGTITATASGTLPNGCTVVVNSNGTVSAVTASAGSPVIGGTTGTGIATTSSQHTATYDTLRNVVFVYYRNNGTGRLNAIVGVVSGTTITWGTPVVVNSTQNLPSDSDVVPITSVFDSTNNIHLCVYTNTGQTDLYASTCTVSASNSISVLQSQTDLGTQGGVYGLCASYNAARNRTVVFWNDYVNNAQVQSFCGTINPANGVFTVGSVTGVQGSVFNGYRTAVTTEPSTGKVIYFWQGQNDYLWSRVAELPTSGNNLQNFGTSVSLTSTNNTNLRIAVGYDVPTGNVVYAYCASSTVVGRAASISGYSLTFGTQTGSIGFATNSGATNFRTMPGTNQTFFVAEGTTSAGTAYACAFTLSGTTVTTGTLLQLNSTVTTNYTRNFVVADPLRLQFIIAGSSGNSIQGNTWTNVSSNMSSDNLIGFSSASYTNGQTATINVVGSVNTAQSGLTAGTKYYVGAAGSLTTVSSQPYAGVALSATSILVKG